MSGAPGSQEPPVQLQTPAQPADQPRDGGALSLIAQSDFRRLWLAGALTGTMRWLETLAVAVFVFGETGNPFLVAVMMFLRMFPMFLFGAIAGVIAERISRKAMLLVGLMFLTANSSVMVTLAVTDLLEIWHVAVAVFIGGIFWSTEFPVRRTMLGEAAGMDRVGLAMGIDSATTNATRMVGPALGGRVAQVPGAGRGLRPRCGFLRPRSFARPANRLQANEIGRQPCRAFHKPPRGLFLHTIAPSHRWNSHYNDPGQPVGIPVHEHGSGDR